MTNSMDKNTPPEIPTIQKKKEKKIYPIRIGALTFICCFSLLMSLYSYFFFDLHLLKITQWSLTKIHGAEVNISHLESSFTKASFLLEGLQITNKENPKENILSIGQIKFNLLWDALLRAKIVINNTQVENIQMYSPRIKAGKVLPKEKTSITKIKNSESLKEVKDTALKQSTKKYHGTTLGDIANLLGGTKPADQANLIIDELVTIKKINLLISELTNKEDKWKQKILAITQKEEIDSLTKKIKLFKLDKKKTFKSVKELSKFLKQIKVKVSETKKITSEIKKEISNHSKTIKNLDRFIEEDINSVTKRLKIPSVDLGDLTKEIFSSMLDKRLGTYKKYALMAKEYLPPPKSKEQKEQEKKAFIKPEKRTFKSKTYHFTKNKSYPFFWLKKGSISSNAQMSEFSGDINGIITDITNESQHIKKPTKIEIKGNFPHQNIYGLKSLITIDRTSSNINDKVSVKIKKFPIKNLLFSHNPNLTLGVKKANASTNLSIISTDKGLQINVNNIMNNITYKVLAKKTKTIDIIKKTITPITSINMNATGSGKNWDDIKWNISSNFANQFSKGIKRELDAKIKDSKQKIRTEILSKVSNKRALLTSKHQKIKNGLENLLNEKVGSAQKAETIAKNLVKKKKSTLVKRPKEKTKKLQKKLKNELKNKLKRFKL